MRRPNSWGEDGEDVCWWGEDGEDGICWGVDGGSFTDPYVSAAERARLCRSEVLEVARDRGGPSSWEGAEDAITSWDGAKTSEPAVMFEGGYYGVSLSVRGKGRYEDVVLL